MGFPSAGVIANVDGAFGYAAQSPQQLNSVTLSPIDVPVYPQTFDAVGDGITDDTAAFTSAIAAANSGNEVLNIPPGTYKLTASLAFTCKVQMADGARLDPTAGTLTFTNSFIAPISRVFNVGTGGSIVFGTGFRTPMVYPQWFGAVGDGVNDDTAAVVATFAALKQKNHVVSGTPAYMGTRVHFPSGRYLISADSLLISTTIHLRITGDGSRCNTDYSQGNSAIIIHGAGTSYGIKFLSGNRARNMTMEHISIEYDSDSFTGHVLNLDATGATLRNVYAGHAGDQDVYGQTAKLLTANACIYLGAKEITLIDCMTDGSQYGIRGGDGGTSSASNINIIGGLVCDHQIAGISTVSGQGPYYGWTIQGVYFDVLDLDGDADPFPTTQPTNGLNINVEGFSVTGCWFSGANANARWSGAAVILSGVGSFTANKVEATLAEALRVGTSANDVISYFSNGLSGGGSATACVILDKGTIVGKDNSITVTGAAAIHVDINPNANTNFVVDLGPDRCVSTVTTSYKTNSSGTSQQGRIVYSSLRDASTSGPSVASDRIRLVPLADGERVSKTADYTLTKKDVGKVFTNTGATGTVIFTLPAVEQGLTYTFFKEVNQTITLTCNGSDVIYHAAAAGAASLSHTTSIKGAWITIRGLKTATWIVSAGGTGWA